MEAEAAKELAAQNPPDTPPPEALAMIKRNPRAKEAPKSPKKKAGQAARPKRKGLAAAGSGDLSAIDMPHGEAMQDEELPEELTASLVAWQQFQGETQTMLLGRTQADNAVHLLQSRVEGKEPDRVTMEV